MFDLASAFWLFFVVIIVYYGWTAFKAKEIAFAAAKRYCDERDVQILDQSVFLRRFWFKRNARGALSLWRVYYFEFTSTGEDRYQGRVIVLGSRVSAVELEPHRIH